MKRYRRLAGRIALGVLVVWVLGLLPDVLAGCLVLLAALVACYLYGVRVGLAAGKNHANAEWGSRAEALGL